MADQLIQGCNNIQEINPFIDTNKRHKLIWTSPSHSLIFFCISRFQDFSVNLYVTQTWTDNRLSFQGLIDAEMLELDSKIISKFWVPDLYFVNEKSSNFHTVTVPNRLLHLYQDGTVVYKIRYTYTLISLWGFFSQENTDLKVLTIPKLHLLILFNSDYIILCYYKT